MRRPLPDALFCWGVLVLTVLSLLHSGCGPARSLGQKERVKVAASIMPLADMARQIGGEYVEVVVVVPAGSDPHTYEPSPGDVSTLSGSQLILRVGAGFDDWVSKVAAGAAPEAEILTLSHGLDLLAETGTEDDERAGNPHIWLDPILMRDFLGPAVADGLAKLLPAQKEYFMENLKLWQEKLTELDSEIRFALSGVSQKYFISFHPAWSYFAKRYGLVELAVLEEKPGEEPTIADLIGLIKAAEAKGKPPIFVEPQFNRQMAETVARQYGGSVYTVDPLGTSSQTYVDLMYENLRVFKEALGGSADK